MTFGLSLEIFRDKNFSNTIDLYFSFYVKKNSYGEKCSSDNGRNTNLQRFYCCDT